MRRKQELAPKPCTVCGVTFAAKPWHSPSAWADARFCSMRCARHARIVPIAERLMRHSERQPNGCVVWTGHTDRQGGYGRCPHDGETLAHRVAWAATHGKIPDGLQVLHSCDNPPCINVDHLFLGTNTDNYRDKLAKQRQHRPIGTRNPRALLTPEQVRRIRRDDRSDRVIANEYGVHTSTVCAIQKGIAWRDV